MARITASTWGPSMKHSRLIYAATIRPAMLYGSQVWDMRDDGKPVSAATIRPLRQAQNQCLRRITGGYKRTPSAALEREAEIPPLDLHLDTLALQRAATIK